MIASLYPIGFGRRWKGYLCGRDRLGTREVKVPTLVAKGATRMGHPELGWARAITVRIPLRARRLYWGAGILRLREPLALPMARFAQDANFLESGRARVPAPHLPASYY